MARNEVIQAVKEFIRHPHAWPGGYPKILLMDEQECLCAKCAKENFRLIVNATRGGLRDEWRAIGIDIYWEGPPMACSHCGTETESAYGVPESE